MDSEQASAETATIEAPLNEPLRSRLNWARTELLDLSARNRLLNTPRRSRTARNIEITDERSTEIFRLLVQDGRKFSFAPGREKRSSDEAAADDGEGRDTALLPQPDEDDLDEQGIARRHVDTKLQTLLTSEGLQKRLLDLYFDARTLEEEQGVNILYLTLGFLKWFEAPNSDIPRFAPLILVPVNLERGMVAERFRLRWTYEEPTSNLSLITLLRREHGLELPGFGDDDAEESADPAEYFRKVSAAVGDKPRWEVHADDIVLGFFSFAKFLMYRDLDPANWPTEVAIDRHPLVTGLLGDGFEGSEPSITEDANIDVHLAPVDLLHVVDADSSQTLAIHEARRGANLVIQGPPGTGKSQTIANVISAAVADGKTVLFVAEKMAALDVVKRRLDNIGLGDMCLELHSNKARKREVLQELKRTWELGRPNSPQDRDLFRRLEAAREALNTHAARLHQRAQPAGLSAYHCIGHLMRLRHDGLRSSDIVLEAPETWSGHDKAAREQALLQLAGYIEDIGMPAQHPWRGVGLDAILRMDLDRLMQRIGTVQARLSELLRVRDDLCACLQVDRPDSFTALEHICVLGAGIGEAPATLDRTAIGDACWEASHEDISDLVAAGEKHQAIQAAVATTFNEAAWSTEVQTLRQHIAIHGPSWLRGLKGEWRRASALFNSILLVPPPKSVAAQLELLDGLAAGQKAAAQVARDEQLGAKAFGLRWRREKSDWGVLRDIAAWNARQVDRGTAAEIRRLAELVEDHTLAGSLAQRIRDGAGDLRAALGQVVTELQLSLAEAFGTAALEEIPLVELYARLNQWIENVEQVSKWIAYRVRADQARAMGIGQIVDRLAEGQLDREMVLGVFETTYYEMLLRAIVSADPELARFDGAAHGRVVQDFRELDLKRIEVARLEVATAHHQRMPSRDGAAGPLGILKGEMARKIGHMPIRGLIRRAGIAVQALKPVFMMSPLSVAQFLEPGGLSFDVLVIDEASQVQPVDALGAVARCKRMIVVGDDRQLPPTTFFNKLMASSSESEDADDGAAQVADIESILGLCTAKGVPN